jgi:choline dehydrogenase
MKTNEIVDYVIVGAGSAGCVLANRLSEDASVEVGIIEAGPMDRDLMIHIPAGVYKVYKDPKINWNYETEVEPDLLQRQVGTPRGKVVGGSSSINSMVYMRGHPNDYDRWASEFGLDKWTFDQCLPYFRRCESNERGESEWHGADGPLGVSCASLKNPLFDAFLEAGEQAGQGRTDDPNGYNPEGVTRLDSTKKNGRRCSAAVAHLKPALSRSNLWLETHALVQRILFEGTRAVGVEYIRKGKTHTVHVRKEVILSGGAINSPQMLMVSGIGPADHLRSHGIEPLVDLPGVGQNLQDHANIILTYECTKPVTIHKVANPVNKALAGAQWLINRTGIAASNIWEAGGCVRGNDRVDYANLQYHFGPFGVEYVGNEIRLDQAFSVHVDQLRPKSSGHIHLKSANPADKPALHFNYMAEEYDRLEMIEGVRTARDLVAQPAFDEFRGREIEPGPDSDSDKDVEAWVRSAVDTDFHPCATCRMGSDDMAVVDGEMRVRGTEGLRVVDASIMPQVVSGNLNAPTQMIGERAADFIRDVPQMAPEHARFSFNDQ